MNITPSRVALVTGANGGIGQAIARSLHRAGAKVIVSGRRADALAPIAAELGARVIVADLSARADVARLAEEAGPVDILVANAALPANGALQSFSTDEAARAIEVNLLAPVLLARACGAAMIERRSGQLVFISSIAGKVPSIGAPLYSATKFGLRAFSLCLRDEMAAHGVGVTTIFPGFIRDAGMFADAKVELPRGTGTRSPDDVAAAVLRAVRDNPAEIDVAAFEQVLGGHLAGLAPAAMITLQRWLGGDAMSRKLVEGQKLKR